MRIWKRVLPLVLVILLLTACGQEADTAVDVVQIGICMRQGEDASTAEYLELLEVSLERRGYYVTRADAENDQTVQIEQIDNFIDRGFDLLIIEPVMLDAADGVMERLKAAGMPAVFVGREPEDAVLALWEKACYVGCDASQPGLLQAQIVMQTPNKGDVNGDGIVSYAVIGGPEDHIDTQIWAEGCAKALTDAGVQVELLGVRYGDWTQESGKQRCQQLLSDFGRDIEAVFCHNDAMALGAQEALQAAGRAAGEDVYLVGIDGEPQALELVRSGAMTGTVVMDIQGQADKAAQTVQALLADETVDRHAYIDYLEVTRENAAEFTEK